MTLALLVYTLRSKPLGNVEWDPGKARANVIKHGVMFDSAERFDWRTALIRIDEAHSRQELRYIAVGHIGMRLHFMVWTPRGAKLRIIGLRKANEKEAKLYEESAETPLDYF